MPIPILFGADSDLNFSDLSLNSKLQISMTPRQDRWTGKKPMIYYAII